MIGSQVEDRRLSDERDAIPWGDVRPRRYIPYARGADVDGGK
jgi:hypothetical protein